VVFKLSDRLAALALCALQITPKKTGDTMKITMLLAFYGGPDQLMPLTSGLTVVFAFLLIFWNKVLTVLGKFLNLFRRSPETAKSSSEAEQKPGAMES
jgi:hypothetical protein